jgi:hypothetical protein
MGVIFFNNFFFIQASAQDNDTSNHSLPHTVLSHEVGMCNAIGQLGSFKQVGQWMNEEEWDMNEPK